MNAGLKPGEAWACTPAEISAYLYGCEAKRKEKDLRAQRMALTTMIPYSKTLKFADIWPTEQVQDVEDPGEALKRMKASWGDK